MSDSKHIEQISLLLPEDVSGYVLARAYNELTGADGALRRITDYLFQVRLQALSELRYTEEQWEFLFRASLDESLPVDSEFRWSWQSRALAALGAKTHSAHEFDAVAMREMADRLHSTDIAQGYALKDLIDQWQLHRDTMSMLEFLANHNVTVEAGLRDADR